MTALFSLILACGAPSAPPPPAPPVQVELTGLAASSLTEVLPKVAEAWKKHGGADLVFSFDSSSKLAKQVEAGAPADLVLFADRETMDGLDGKGLLAPETRRDLLGNTLVVVVPANATWVPTSVAELSSPTLTHLALAGENVPAGKYARAALAGAEWSALEPKVVTGDNVRTTLAWVARGEAEAGVVYATDAKAEPKVKLAFAFPDDSHPPIVYPGAAVAASTHPTEAAAFLAFCASADGMAIFTAAGFTPPPATK
ncbi:MAG: molybdate ABC transporter substrate-binding protein [Myxococcota bacterium]